MREFQARVLELVSKVPRGKVTTYKEIARAIGNPGACRAVGGALANNPSPIKIPCHRVVKSNGELGGYKLGSREKERLLSAEGIVIKDGKVDLKKHLFRFE
jgi:methylated-DNA-[protein]-cysteine S-methyltransferase